MADLISLRRYVESESSITALADLLGTTKQVVWAWLDRDRVPIEWCARIEIATNGAVTRRDLRPTDWMRIWPELATPAAPAAPQGEVVNG